MYKQHALVFFYCTTPVHMGSGTSVGAVDNPIQREVHTNHPIFAGSGIKGALRHYALTQDGVSDDEILTIFGPEAGDAKHAGAISFSDASVLLFPVRSLKKAFAYVTCPLALARLHRLSAMAGISAPLSMGPVTIGEMECYASSQSLVSNESQNDPVVVLEHLVLNANSASQNIKSLIDWIGDHALHSHDSWSFFRQKVKEDTLIVHDDRLGDFVQSSTVVEPHVRIDDVTGTVAEGALFYTENLPPETLMVGLVSVSDSRGGKSSLDAGQIMGRIKQLFDNKTVQIGGDATTGRGLVALRIHG